MPPLVQNRLISLAALSDSPETFLTPRRLDIMLPNRAADVPTGARDTLETRPSDNRCACEVNMLPVKPLPHSSRIRSLCEMQKHLCSALLLLTTLVPPSFAQSVPPPPQGTQTDAAFGDSFKSQTMSPMFSPPHKRSAATRRRYRTLGIWVRLTAIPARSRATAARIQAKTSDLTSRKTS